MCKLGGPALLCNLENLVALAARFTTELACNRALTVSAPPVYSIYQGDGRSSEFVLSLVRWSTGRDGIETEGSGEAGRWRRGGGRRRCRKFAAVPRYRASTVRARL